MGSDQLNIVCIVTFASLEVENRAGCINQEYKQLRDLDDECLDQQVALHENNTGDCPLRTNGFVSTKGEPPLTKECPFGVSVNQHDKGALQSIVNGAGVMASRAVMEQRGPSKRSSDHSTYSVVRQIACFRPTHDEGAQPSENQSPVAVC